MTAEDGSNEGSLRRLLRMAGTRIRSFRRRRRGFGATGHGRRAQGRKKALRCERPVSGTWELPCARHRLDR